MKKILTIGMAVYDDFDGIHETISALRLYHDLSQVELLVIDNHPNVNDEGSEAQRTKRFCDTSEGVTYIPFHSAVGTSPPRNEVFRRATTPWVMCIDSHIMLSPPRKSGQPDYRVGVDDGLTALLDYIKDNWTSAYLIQGPLQYNNLRDCDDHFMDTWRDEMWGIWGRTWKCFHCQGTFAVIPYVTPEDTKTAFCAYRAVSMGFIPVTQCSCGNKYPERLPYNSHEKELRKLGYLEMAHLDKPYEIPGMGLGLFACRKDVWPGFNPHFRGFGGEEMYIHEKFRQMGQRTICLPQLKWVHRFGRRAGLPSYPLTRYNKVRNYVLGFRELGYDVLPVYEHFVKSGKLSQQEWEFLLSDPINNIDPTQCNSCNKPRRASGYAMLPDTIPAYGRGVIDWLKSIPRDLDQHLDKLAELAEQCSHVTEFSHRRESLAALSLAKSVTSYNTEGGDPLIEKMAALPEGQNLEIYNLTSDQLTVIGNTDLLFIDSKHTYTTLNRELQDFAHYVRRYIVLHDTDLYGEKGEDGGPGLMVALREFLKANPVWTVIYHTRVQHGLTVISCHPDDKPKLPSIITMAGNFTQALATHMADGMGKATKEQMEARLLVCSVCPQRSDSRCAACGCELTIKASWRTGECPLGYWDTTPKE